jgi:hypothetical protein
MSATHGIEIVVRVFPDEMDGSPEESAEIIWGLVHDALGNTLGSHFETAVTECWEVIA